jgi:hypothetical protein
VASDGWAQVGNAMMGDCQRRDPDQHHHHHHRGAAHRPERDHCPDRPAQLAAKVSNPESHNFSATLVIPSAIPGAELPGPLRGWSAVDVKVRGKTVRFVNTHLEAFSVVVRNQQARELATALAGSAPPVVLVGDLKLPARRQRRRLRDLRGRGVGGCLGGGARPGGRLHRRPERAAGQRSLQAGPPCRLRAVPAARVEAVAAEVIGKELEDRTAAGLWPVRPCRGGRHPAPGPTHSGEPPTQASSWL